MTDIDLSELDRVAALKARIAELDERLARRDATIEKLEQVIAKLRIRCGEGWREEVRTFSDSIKDLLK